MNSRALSGVVAVSLMIFLAVAAIGAIYFYFQPYLSGSSLSPAFSCLNMKLNAPVEIQDVCINLTSQKIEIGINQKGDISKISSVDFSMTENGNENARWTCGGECSTCGFNVKTNKYYLPAEAIEYNSTMNASISLQISNCFFADRKLRAC